MYYDNFFELDKDFQNALVAKIIKLIKTSNYTISIEYNHFYDLIFRFINFLYKHKKSFTNYYKGHEIQILHFPTKILEELLIDSLNKSSNQKNYYLNIVINSIISAYIRYVLIIDRINEDEFVFATKDLMNTLKIND